MRGEIAAGGEFLMATYVVTVQRTQIAKIEVVASSQSEAEERADDLLGCDDSELLVARWKSYDTEVHGVEVKS